MDRKRPRQEEPSPASKKPKQEQNEEDEEEFPEPKDWKLLLYQNRAMFARLSELKRNLTEVQCQVQKLESETSDAKAAFALVDKHWLGLDKRMLQLLEHLPGTEDESDITLSPKSLCAVLSVKTPDDDRLKQLEATTLSRLEWSSGAITSLGKRLEAYWSRQTQLQESLKSGSADQAAKEELEKLAQELTQSRSAHTEQQKRVAELNDQVQNAELQLSELEVEHGKVTEERDDLVESLEQRNRTIHRLKQELIKAKQEAAEASKAAAEASSASASASASVTATSSGDSSDTKKEQEEEEEKASSKAEVNNELVEELEGKIEEMRQLCESRQKTIDEQSKEIEEGIHKSTQLENRLNNLPEDLIQSTPSYKRLQYAHNQASNTLKEHRETTERLYRQNMELAQQRDNNALSYQNLVNDQVKTLEAQLQQKSDECVRLSGEVDGLSLKYETLAKTAGDKKVSVEHRHLLKSQEQAINKMRKEAATMSAQLQDLQACTSDPNHAASIIKEKSAQCETLKSELESVKKQVQEWEGKEKAWKEKEKDLSFTIDIFQESGKDRRDLTEVRIAERKVQEELKATQATLKAQMAELDELKALKANSLQVTDEPGLLLKKENEDLTAKLAAAEKTAETLKSQIAGKKAQEAALILEVEEVGSAFDDLQAQNTRLMTLVNEKEDANIKLTRDLLRQAQAHKLDEKVQQAMSDSLRERDRKINDLEMLLSNSRGMLHSLQTTYTRYRQETDFNASNLLARIKETADKIADYEVLKSKLETAQSLADKLQQEIAQHRVKTNKSRGKIRTLEEDRGQLKKKLELFRSRGSVGDEILQEELDMYKKKLICSQCNERPKDSVITRCFHTFCHVCLDNNISQRHRKCPGCGKPFDKGDIKRFYL